MNILVTGGAGYIGSHVVSLLTGRGDSVLVVDDLTTGRAEAVGGAELVQLDISADGAAARLAELISSRGIGAVVHIAAKKQVGESVEKPLMYYRQNLVGMLNLLEAMAGTGADRIVFSSSAATYGVPPVDLVDERTPCSPINPYGQTKLVGEWFTQALAKAEGLRVANLRYFNVAGAASPELADRAALNLVPIVFNRLAEGKRPVVFGDDYPTPDGTCIRDYVHVADLADAHLAALDYLDRPERNHEVFNVGTGTGASVAEVLRMISEVTGLDTTAEVMPRRAGDPPQLTAAVDLIRDELGWTSSRSLRDIIESTWEAHLANHGPIEQAS